MRVNPPRIVPFTDERLRSSTAAGRLRLGLCLWEVSFGYLPVMKNKTLVIRAVVTLRVCVIDTVAVSGLFGGIQR